MCGCVCVFMYARDLTQIKFLGFPIRSANDLDPSPCGGSGWRARELAPNQKPTQSEP